VLRVYAPLARRAIFAKEKTIQAKPRDGYSRKVTAQKEQAMETILLLNDKSGSGKLGLPNVASSKVTVRPSEGSPGCNCDRWGHPCPYCVERDVQPDAELPIQERAEPTTPSNAVHLQA